MNHTLNSGINVGGEVYRYAFMYHTNVRAAQKFLHNSPLFSCPKNGRAALYYTAYYGRRHMLLLCACMHILQQMNAPPARAAAAAGFVCPAAQLLRPHLVPHFRAVVSASAVSG
jgi:hypothetical protein